MKKIFLAVALAVSSVFAIQAEDAKTEGLTYRQMREQCVSPERLANVKTVRAIYTYTDSSSQGAVCMIRAKKDNKIRVDFLVDGEVYTTVRNGSDFWCYEKEGGVTALNESDAAEFIQIASFLAIQFCTESVFSNPVKIGADTNNGKARTIYEVKTTDGTNNTYKMWVEDASKLLRRVQVTDADGKMLAVLFSNFKDYNGVKVPGTMYVSNVRGAFTRKLVSADWNLEINDSIFERKSKIADRDLALLKECTPTQKVKASNQKVQRNQARIAKLEEEIFELKLKIENDEKMLAKMENVANKQFDTVVGLSAITGSSHGRRRYWGWSSSSYDGAANRDSRNRRTTIREVGSSLESVTTKYKNLNKQILDERIKLHKKEVQLSNLKAATQEIKEEEE